MNRPRWFRLLNLILGKLPLTHHISRKLYIWQTTAPEFALNPSLVSNFPFISLKFRHPICSSKVASTAYLPNQVPLQKGCDDYFANCFIVTSIKSPRRSALGLTFPIRVCSIHNFPSRSTSHVYGHLPVISQAVVVDIQRCWLAETTAPLVLDNCVHRADVD